MAVPRQHGLWIVQFINAISFCPERSTDHAMVIDDIAINSCPMNATFVNPLPPPPQSWIGRCCLRDIFLSSIVQYTGIIADLQ